MLLRINSYVSSFDHLYFLRKFFLRIDSSFEVLTFGLRMAGEGHAIGIDLGTTYSCVAVWQHDHVEVIVNDQGNRMTPSYVAFTDTEQMAGDTAFNQVMRNPTNSIYGRFVSSRTCIDLHTTFNQIFTHPHACIYNWTVDSCLYD